jgi:hypothetical protein
VYVFGKFTVYVQEQTSHFASKLLAMELMMTTVDGRIKLRHLLACPACRASQLCLSLIAHFMRQAALVATAAAHMF